MGTRETMASTKCKSLIVGDGAIGKTCLLSRLTNEAIDWSEEPEYEPTTFNNFNLVWDDEDEQGNARQLELELWDTAGQEGFEQLRTLSYPGTDIYMVGYACNSLISLNNIEHKWMVEINKCRDEAGETGAPWIIMVGTKSDIRTDVTLEKAKEVAKAINACTLVDTSAKVDDPEEAGVLGLEGLIKMLGFMKAGGKPRPNWGDFDGDKGSEPDPVKSDPEPDPSPNPPNTDEKKPDDDAVCKCSIQ